MTLSKKNIFIIITSWFLLANSIFSPDTINATECDCNSDTASPPFLAAGADPNLLLLIDNSASMYDIAYLENTGECFDDSYDSNAANPYAGYFESDTWYHYDTTDNRFEPVSAPAVCEPSAAGGAAYNDQQTGAPTYLCVKMWEDATDKYADLTAKGDILNWATASKFDIQKKILTGGKYDTNELVSEGRGCSGYRFIKQVTVYESTGGTLNNMAMGIHADDNDTTLIDIFQINETGFDATACQGVLTEMQSDNASLGTLKGLIDDCMEYDNNQSYAGTHELVAFNHAMQDCWYADKHGWPSPIPQYSEEKNACEDLYEAQDPDTIDPSSPGYICYGDYGTKEGYIGRCWVPAVGAVGCQTVSCALGDVLPDGERCNGNNLVEECSGNYNANQDTCNKPWILKQINCTGDSGYTEGYWDESDNCIDNAVKDFCQVANVPQIVDPSDQTQSTGEVWNLPAMLIDSGALGQLGDPFVTIKGVVQKEDAPTGLLQQYADTIRIGAMAFNSDGSKSECDEAEPYVTYACDEADNRDGAYLVQPIGGNTPDLITHINDIKADSWTPLAEAMFNAIGYYTQKSDFVIDENDLKINSIAADAPINEYCQANNIVIITDGASTADLNPLMTAKVDEVSTDSNVECGALYGSTYLDDLIHYARTGDIYTNSPSYSSFGEFPENISTYIVVNGTPRNSGSGECNPTTLLTNAADNGSDKGLFEAGDPEELYSKLDELFQYTLERAASGSAASVIAATRSGEGAVYQAIFWPNMKDPAGDPTVTWVGEVQSLMVDALGNLYEDTNNNAILNTGEADPLDDDERVVFYYDNGQRKTMACYGGTVDILAGTCSGTSKDLNEVNYLWSAAEWLANIADADISENRTDYLSNEKKRYIFTWNDLNLDGKVGSVFEFEEATKWNFLSGIATAAGRGSLFSDFGVADSNELNKIINWMRGQDTITDNTIRDRQVPKPTNFNTPNNPVNITWRLGDIVHSTPTVVGKPTESYHLLYKDSTYVEFYLKYQHRRSVIYFGANDGMLHAVNGGFYDATANAFCKDLDNNNDCLNGLSEPELGAELWAYVPYNLQPHLKCLLDPDYRHKYFMDLKPRIFDVKIFKTDTDHPGGWGTILVAGMGLGGKEISSDAAGDTRKFISSYVIMDITNPEEKPELLAELTFDAATSANMGFTTAIPAVVPMKPNDSDVSQWYLVFGNGPTNLDGTSDQKPRIGVFNLNSITGETTGATKKPFRITDGLDSNGGSIELDASDPTFGFVSDPITMDFLIEGSLNKNYRGDAIYFGTVEGSWDATGGWGGKLYRWVTNSDSDDDPAIDGTTTPNEWGKIADNNEPNLMINAGRPITAAPSIGWDSFNYWVYFGTGRFYHADDKTDPSSNGQDTFYGLKEPIDRVDGSFTWNEIGNKDAITGSGVTYETLPGSRNLLRTDQILVTASDSPYTSALSCADSSNCLPDSDEVGGSDDKVNLFSELEDFVAGTGFHYDGMNPDGYTGTDGWYLNFPQSRERNLGQATLLGGLTTFTTYQPFSDICLLEGLANLYGLYYKTGTAWHESVFTNGTNDSDPPKVLYMKQIGLGLATTPNLHIGKADGAKAIVQTSTGAIVEIEQPDLPLKASKSGRASWLNE